MKSVRQPAAVQELWHRTLTAAQATVVELAATGLTDSEIAERLFCSRATVRFHMAQAFRATDTRNRVELARWWIETVERPPSTTLLDHPILVELWSAPALRDLTRALHLLVPARALLGLRDGHRELLDAVLDPLMVEADRP